MRALVWFSDSLNKRSIIVLEGQYQPARQQSMPQVVAVCQHWTTMLVVTETLSIKIPVETKARLRAAAKHRHTTPSMLLRDAIDLVLRNKSVRGKVSLYDLNRDLFEGKQRGGPRDLSTNPRYLKDFGK
jgi:hypothetical protein